MTNDQIALIELGAVGGTGLFILFLGLMFCSLQKKKMKRCTGCTLGRVVGYQFLGEGRMRPVTEYQVGGRSYKAARHFRGYVVKSRNFGKNIYRGKGAYVSEKDYVHVTLGRITNLRAMAEELWPLGSEMTVYYNPDNPKQAFVERLPVKAAVEGIIFIWTGAGIMLLSVLMTFLIRQ